MTDAPDPAVYCREIEAYLCRKNEGHLIRIVGPAFQQVCGWAERGIPLKVAFRGIDRCVERYHAKGPRRRPVRIEFCEADVLDVFDEWRRALGIAGTVTGSSSTPGRDGQDRDRHESDGQDDRERHDGAGGGRHGSLPAHLDRVLARLAAVRAGTDRTFDERIETIQREIDAARAGATRLRGETRQAFIRRLHEMDRALLDAARGRIAPDALRQLAIEAAAELAPFRGRLAPDAYERSRAAALDRLIREHLHLPVVAYE